MKKGLMPIVTALLAGMLLTATPASGAAVPSRATQFTGGVVVPDPIGSGAKTGPVAGTNADWTWGWVTGTVYLNRSETNKVAAGFGLGGVLGAVVSVGSVAAFYGTLAVYANYVYNAGGCLKFKIYPGVPPLLLPNHYYPSSGHGYYCR